MKIPKRINDIIEELKDQYLEEDRAEFNLQMQQNSD